jgi:hypothetical protein
MAFSKPFLFGTLNIPWKKKKKKKKKMTPNIIQLFQYKLKKESKKWYTAADIL